MERKEMFQVLRTCIIGESFRACGVGYHPEDALETYHASEFLENVDEDEVHGSFDSAEHFLESLCSSTAGKVYNTIREMERFWNDEPFSRFDDRMAKLLWDLGNAEALQYIDDNFGQEVGQEFLDHGSFKFDEKLCCAKCKKDE
ncbi:unnamed protein product [Ectocarpus sp. 12 AP-2014]